MVPFSRIGGIHTLYTALSAALKASQRPRDRVAPLDSPQNTLVSITGWSWPGVWRHFREVARHMVAGMRYPDTVMLTMELAGSHNSSRVRRQGSWTKSRVKAQFGVL